MGKEALIAVANMPARVKCALLAWHTVEDMLEKNKQKKVWLILKGQLNGK